jgi:hypothetical protein
LRAQTADSHTSTFAGKRACNRVSNAARAPEHDSISSSQTKSIRISSVDPGAL